MVTLIDEQKLCETIRTLIDECLLTLEGVAVNAEPQSYWSRIMEWDAATILKREKKFIIFKIEQLIRDRNEWRAATMDELRRRKLIGQQLSDSQDLVFSLRKVLEKAEWFVARAYRDGGYEGAPTNSGDLLEEIVRLKAMK